MDAKSYYHRFCKLGPVSTKFQVSQKKKLWPLSSSGFPECFSEICSFPWSHDLDLSKHNTRARKNEGQWSGRKVSVYPRKKSRKFCKYRKKWLHLRAVNGRGKSMIISSLLLKIVLWKSKMGKKWQKKLISFQLEI